MSEGGGGGAKSKLRGALGSSFQPRSSSSSPAVSAKAFVPTSSVSMSSSAPSESQDEQQRRTAAQQAILHAPVFQPRAAPAASPASSAGPLLPAAASSFVPRRILSAPNRSNEAWAGAGPGATTPGAYASAAATGAHLDTTPTPVLQPGMAPSGPAFAAVPGGHGALPKPSSVAMERVPAASLPHTAEPHAGFRSLQYFFVDVDQETHLLARNRAILQGPNLEDPRVKVLPTSLGNYHSLSPLDDPSRDQTISFYGFSAPLYKCVSGVNGLPHVVRRLEGFRLQSHMNVVALDFWQQLRHPNLVTLREVFSTPQWGDVDSLYLVYDYHPLAETLETKYFARSGAFFPERVLWSYVCQLTSAINVIHTANLACRCVYPSKVLVTDKNRLRINGLGVLDAVSYDPAKTIHHQREDLLALGKLILCLACRSAAAVQNVQASLDFVSQQYTEQVKALIVFLLTKPTTTYPTISDVVHRIAGHSLRELDHALHAADALQDNLSKALENGRIARLMMKLNFVNEKPDLKGDHTWSNTGDRFLLKLFRDYVFHQVYDDGAPVCDFGHVVECLNKLDAGLEEKVSLMTTDQQSFLVVSYKDLRRCLDQAFKELTREAFHG